MFSALVKYVLLIVVVTWILGLFSSSKTDSYKLYIDSRRMTNEAIERKDMERERLGLPPVTKEEIEGIAAQSVRKAQSIQRY